MYRTYTGVLGLLLFDCSLPIRFSLLFGEYLLGSL